MDPSLHLQALIIVRRIPTTVLVGTMTVAMALLMSSVPPQMFRPLGPTTVTTLYGPFLIRHLCLYSLQGRTNGNKNESSLLPEAILFTLRCPFFSV